MDTEEINRNILYRLKAIGRFTKEDIRAFLEEAGLSITDEALRIRIHRWKNKGLLKSVARGEYSVSKNSVYTFEANRFIKKVNNLILQKYDGVEYCIWYTHILNDFMIHQPVNAYYVIEIEKEFTEGLFYYLKDHNIKVFHNPLEQIMQDYVLGDQDVIIIKPLISRAPLQSNEEVSSPTLEKVLVDIFCDMHQFSIYGGQEMIYIFRNAFEHYIINESSLYTYASRRNKKDSLTQFIKENIII